MPTELTFAAAFFVGLLGSSHCIGMCGGIVAALNLGIDSKLGAQPRALFVYQLAYNLGRIGSYICVGLVAGSLGATLVELGLSPLAGRLLAAAFMIALGLYLANWWRGLSRLERAGAVLWRQIQPIGQKLFPIRNPLQALLLGGLWGWLPCGLVYTAVAWSLTSGGGAEGALLMLGFGLGTLPSMLLAGNLFGRLKQGFQAPAIRTTAGVLMILFGIYSAYSGITGGHHAPHPHHADSASFAAPTPPSRLPASLLNIS